MIPDFKMDQWWQYLVCALLLIVGVAFLVKGSDTMVSGASSLAKKFKISGMVIGLTIVAFGTSCPELAVSVSDSITCLIQGGNAEVAIGNVVGSNICNLVIVLGCSAIFTPIIIKKDTVKKEFPILIFVSVLLLIFGLTAPHYPPYKITRWEGAILTVLIIAYVIFLVFSAKRSQKLNGNLEADETDKIEEFPMAKSIIFTIVGLIAVFVGGEATVYGAKNIAVGIGKASGADVNLVTSLVGLTVVAVGTSLPELVTSAVAAKKGQNDMALGNVIGSNIFNILFVLGIAATVNPLTSGSQLMVDLFVMMGATLIVFGFAIYGKIGRKGGIFLLVLYAGYLSYLICRTCGLCG